MPSNHFKKKQKIFTSGSLITNQKQIPINIVELWALNNLSKRKSEDLKMQNELKRDYIT